jgi:hypothetical protein
MLFIYYLKAFCHPIDAGCTAHITKPFTRKQILNTLIETLPAEMLNPGNSADPRTYRA